MQTIQDKLRAWGRRRAIDDPPNGYTIPNWVEQIQNPGDQADRVSVIQITDDEHERVDRAIGDLKICKREHYQVIEYSYRFNLPDSKIAQRARWITDKGEERRSRSWVRAIRENAEHWLEGKISC